MTFRKDINALRCIAVMAVLLYHFNISWFNGGFIGVDVFFVISGYLMTGIILGRYNSGKFSLLDFWLSRARRILPALIVFLLVILVFGWFWLSPYTYKKASEFVVSSVLFYSNILFKRQSGYFADSALENWLLHTWSLSVEWQFYLVFPLILLLFFRVSSKSRVINALLIVYFVWSLAFCIYKTPIRQMSAFYYLSCRSWEFLAGTLVYIFFNHIQYKKQTRYILEYSGLLVIIGSVIFLDDHLLWPGYYATIPVVGTMLVLIAANNQPIWAENFLVESIGKWSYSIYLWHWPLVAGIWYFGVTDNAYVKISALVIAIICGAISYHVIEQPVRINGKKWSRSMGYLYAFISIAIVVSASVAVIRMDGFPSRVSDDIVKIDKERENRASIGNCKTRDPLEKIAECKFGNTDNIKVAVWGDSHARAMITVITQLATQDNVGIIYFNKPGCPTIFNAVRMDSEGDQSCPRFNQAVFNRINKYSNLSVIIINRFARFVEKEGPKDETIVTFDGYVPATDEERRRIFQQRLQDSLCRIAEKQTVYVVKPVPEMKVEVPQVAIRSLMVHGELEDIHTTREEYNKHNQAVLAGLDAAEQRCGVKLLDPTRYFCANGKCSAFIKGHPLYRDTNHISSYGEEALRPMFSQVFSDLDKAEK